MRRLGILLLSLIELASGPTGTRPQRLLETRQRIFQVAAGDPVQRALEKRARLTVVYWPAVGRWVPCELPVRESLQSVSAAYPDIRILFIMPEAASGTTGKAQSTPPGEQVVLPSSEYSRQASWSPLPRVEAWTADGDLVLLKSIPQVLGNDGGLRSDVEGLRSLTAPLEER